MTTSTGATGQVAIREFSGRNGEPTARRLASSVEEPTETGSFPISGTRSATYGFDRDGVMGNHAGECLANVLELRFIRRFEQA